MTTKHGSEFSAHDFRRLRSDRFGQKTRFNQPVTEGSSTSKLPITLLGGLAL